MTERGAPTIAPTAPPPSSFGAVFGPTMPLARFDGAAWSTPDVVPIASFQLHPGAHALHYGSACFEGLKAHRQVDGSVRAFRAPAHVARLRQSAARLRLPVPPEALVAEMIDLAVDANADLTPATPGSLYLRPTLLGMDESVGKATSPSDTAAFYVLGCPVGEYLAPRPVVIAVETALPRTTPQFGVVKAGANYAMALAPTMEARERDGADQVLFAPDGVLQETGASNIVFVDGRRLLTPALSDAYLHGVTRDSLLRLARARGWTVEEREVTVDEALARIASPTAEVALTGTAAIVAPVGTIVVDGTRHEVGTPDAHPGIDDLRGALVEIQTGRTTFDW